MNDSDKTHTFRIGMLSSIATIAMLMLSEIVLEIFKKIDFIKIPDDEISAKIILCGTFLFTFIMGIIIFKYNKLNF